MKKNELCCLDVLDNGKQAELLQDIKTGWWKTYLQKPKYVKTFKKGTQVTIIGDDGAYGHRKVRIGEEIVYSVPGWALRVL